MILNVPELVVQDISDLNLCHDVHHFPHRGVRVDDLSLLVRESVVLGVDCLLHNDDHVRPNVAFLQSVDELCLRLFLVRTLRIIMISYIVKL